MSWKTVVGATLMVLAAAAAEARTDLWLHIKVREGEDGSRVSINLPLSVVEAAAPLIPDEARVAGKLRVGAQELSVADLRRIWNEARRQPDGTFITVDEASGSVKVARRGGALLIRAVDRASRHDDRVEVRIPAAVVDALLSGSGDNLNLAAAVEALARTGEGELVTVNGENETVHLWVDGNAEGQF
jgi:hypothetical protein